MASQLAQTTPILTTAIHTVTTTVPPIFTKSTAGTSTLAIVTATTTTIPEASLSMEEMMKEIKPLELQMAELKEAKEKLAKVEVNDEK